MGQTPIGAFAMGREGPEDVSVWINHGPHGDSLGSATPEDQMWSLACSGLLNTVASVSQEDVAWLANAFVATKTVHAETMLRVARREGDTFVDVFTAIHSLEATGTGADIVALTSATVSAGSTATVRRTFRLNECTSELIRCGDSLLQCLEAWSSKKLPTPEPLNDTTSMLLSWCTIVQWHTTGWIVPRCFAAHGMMSFILRHSYKHPSYRLSPLRNTSINYPL